MGARTTVLGVASRGLATILIGTGASAGMSACSAEPDANSSAARLPIAGGNTAVVTNSSAMPEAAVGVVSPPPGYPTSCSGTAIQRDVILTAAHCLCISPVQAGQINFRLPTPVGAGTTVPSKGFSTHGTLDECDGDTSLNDHSKTRDLGVVFLSRNLTVAELPDVAPVYTSGDFLDRIFNFSGSQPSQPGFFGKPMTVVGWGGGAGNADNFVNRHKGTPGSSVYFTLQCGIGGLACEDGYTIEIDSSSVAKPFPGDSGGPIFFRAGGATDTIFGVFSALGPGANERYWSPTWDNGEGNGKFIRQFLNDSDDDGVNDAVDNCNPKEVAACSNNVQKCANPNQDDIDTDGIGDACDNCPGSLCVQRGQPAATCANTNQLDILDGDGVGDACDNCPLKSNAGGQTADPDGDRVGSACDNCQDFNPSAACKGPADCGGGLVSCVASPAIYGRCTDAFHYACFSDGDCFGGLCAGLGQWGRCVEQKDANGNHVGPPCDRCDNVPGVALFSNSNDRAEQREDEATQGDACDEVPLFVSKAVVTLLSSGASLPYDPTKVTLFRSSAGIGSQSGTPHASVTAQVGFRHCNCHVGGTLLTPDECFGISCDADPAQYSFPDQFSSWKRITIGSNLPGFPNAFSFPPAVSGYDPTYTRTFDGSQTFKDSLPYLSSKESKRLGKIENLFWSTHDDIAASHVAAFNGGVNTVGFLWSHVLFSGSGASTRDQASGGRLRDSYEYLKTPTVQFVQFKTGVALAPCEKANCGLTWRKDWLVQPSNPLIVLTNPLAGLPPVARLLSHPDGSIVSVANAGQPVLDVTPALSQTLRLLLQQSDVTWLSPVEAGDRGTQSGSAELVAVAFPRNWVQTREPLIEVLSTPQGLITSIDRRGGIASVSASGQDADRFIPGDRNGARAVLSGTERAVYLVGGIRAPQNEQNTGEVWRYDLDRGEWVHVLTPLNEVGAALEATSPSDRAAPGNVLAIAFHDITGKLVLIDDQPLEKKDAVNKLTVSRIMVLDLKKNVSKVAVTIPRVGAYDDLRLVARENGRFILVGVRRSAQKWTAFEFAIGPDHAVHWLSRMQGSGLVLDDPVNTANGVYLPVAHGGEHGFVDLDASLFTPWPAGCSES